MTCPKCKSENVTAQIVSEAKIKTKGHGALYWIFIGWWLQPMLWMIFTLPMIIIAIFKPKTHTSKITHKSMAICQDCGHSWAT